MDDSIKLNIIFAGQLKYSPLNYHMLPSNFRSIKRSLPLNRKRFRSFLNKTGKTAPKGIDALSAKVEKEVWKDIDCLDCANCCKKMTPTFTTTDIKRISAHFKETPEAFRKKWLRKDRNKDLINKSEPCQFLNLENNKCSIYAIRPADCAGFPHLSKKKWSEYTHVHKQNIEFCPATYKMVEKMIEKVSL